MSPNFFAMISGIFLRKMVWSFCFLFCVKTFAWGLTGHRVVAEIAERHLSVTVKTNLQKIIGNQKLAYWANWADDIKSDSTEVWKPTGKWHYLDVDNIPEGQSFKDYLSNAKAPNLYTQIQTLESQIKDMNTPAKDKEIALRFLIHLMGDLAQPLHVGHTEDLGGNKIQVNFFGEAVNLHSVWDYKMIEHSRYSYTEFAQVLDIKSDTENQQIQSGTLEDWFYDTQKQAMKVYADVPQNLGYQYLYKFNPLLERQLLYGGLRLAKVLNDVLQ